MKRITREMVVQYEAFLIDAEKSRATVQKYVRDVLVFTTWLAGRELNKGAVLQYKEKRIAECAPRSVNSVISSLNNFFSYMGWQDCKVKSLKIQRQIFAEKALTKAEYTRLLAAAKDDENERLYYLMQTICATGIRVSELPCITVDAVRAGRAVINCKGKMRTVFLPKKLCRMLMAYVKKRKIACGSVFVSKNGRPLDRSNIWTDMKKLCERAGVASEKVFPHNLRHLFAITYYSLQKDIVRLADILGHSSVETTRLYTMESGETHRRQIQELGLLQ